MLAVNNPVGVLKMAGVSAFWETLRDFVSPEARRAKKEIAEHVKSDDPKKWDRFLANAAQSPEFIHQLERSKSIDAKDLLHAVNMTALQKAPVSGQVESASNSGTQYQVKKLDHGGYGCTCNDWRFRGSVRPGYECKHIKAFKSGLTKVAGFQSMTAAFFDELQKIRDEKQRKTFAGVHVDSSRPYSNLLTPGETDFFNHRPVSPISEPDLILGPGFRQRG